MGARAASVLAVLAGCCARPAAPAPPPQRPVERLPTRPVRLGDGSGTPAPVVEPPPQSLELDELSCPRGAVDLPGQSPPDRKLVGRLVEHSWCWFGSDVDVELSLAGDGTLREVRRVPATASTSGGASANGGCWGLAGDRLYIRRGTRWWDGWTAAVAGNVLDWRGRGWVACAPRE